MNKMLHDAFGSIAIVVILRRLYRFVRLINTDDTVIISKKARAVIRDQEKSKELRKAINTYHQTGDWNKTKIFEILKENPA